MEKVTFGDWVRGNRIRTKLSQSALGREIGMDRGHISKIESGHIGLPEEETRARFHRVFGTSEQELIEEGIVPQYDRWGRPINRDTAVVAVNPFEDELRHELFEYLVRVDPKGPNAKETNALIRGANVAFREFFARHEIQEPTALVIDTKSRSR